MMRLFYFLILLVPMNAFSQMCSISDVLQRIRPGAEWQLQGTAYSGLTWIDQAQTKPTLAEVQTGIAACQSAVTTRTTLKTQARLDVKNSSLTQAQRLQALLILLDYDQ